MSKVFDLDYETFSEVDLSEVGAYRYAEDPSTEILMAAISSEDEGPYLWVHPRHETTLLCSDPRAERLLTVAFNDPESIIWAHNAQFERALTRYRGAADFGSHVYGTGPSVRQWRCSAAVARKAALPDRLEELAITLKLREQKDPKGKALIKRFSMLQPKTNERITALDDPSGFYDFGLYCLQDIRTEKEARFKLKPFELVGSTLEMFFLDAQLNDGGVPVNVEALMNAKRIIDECLVERYAEFEKLTGLRQTQREKVKAYLAERGIQMANMKRETLEESIERLEEAPNPTPELAHALDVLRRYAELNFAAAKKVHTMLDCVNEDGRVRGTLLFYGAGTGRWAGRLIQPQNFKKPTIKDTDLAYRMICDGCTREELAMIFGNPLEVIASCIRHFIQDPRGEIADADYNAIEARIVNWLAGQEDALERYRKGIDAYRVMAGIIFNKRPDDIHKESKERDLGKSAELGCGFGMGAKKFMGTCHMKGQKYVDMKLAQKAVDAYRALHDKVVQLWYDSDRAARCAIRHPGKEFKAGKLTFIVRTLAGIPFLLMRLPSGRSIAYPWPRVEMVSGEDRESITFWGQVKGQTWGRVKTYGGKLVENATQGTAADVMSNGACNVLKLGDELLTLIHDQALGFLLRSNIETFCQALSDLPEWAQGLPIKAEGKIVKYYRK